MVKINYIYIIKINFQYFAINFQFEDKLDNNLSGATIPGNIKT